MRASRSIDQTAALGSMPIPRLLWHTCSQTTLSVGIYGIYALSNAWFVSWGVGPTGLAAVNLVAPVILLLGAVSTTVGIGGASLVSRALGAGDTRRAAKAAGTAFAVFWTTAIVVTVAGSLLIEPLLTLLGAEGPTRDLAREYAVIIIAGSITFTGFSSLVRAEGRMRFSTMLWVIPVLTQITLDPLLIFGFGLGVRGAALGTIGGQAVSMGMSVWFFFLQRERPYRVGRPDLFPRWPMIADLATIGAPSFLAGFGATMLIVLVNNILAAAAGVAALSAFALCSRIQTFVTMPQVGITQGLQPIVGFNAGRGLLDRVVRTRTLALRSTLVYGTIVALIMIVCARPVVEVFVSDPAVRDTATGALRIIAIGFTVSGVAMLVSAYFQSLGQPRPSYVISIGTLVVIKVPLVLMLSQGGVVGLWLSLPLGEIVSAAAALLILRRFGRARAARP